MLKRNMSKHFKFLIAFVLLISFSVTLSFAQTKEELQKKKESILKEIDSMQKELDKTKKNKTSSLTEVKALQQKILSREKLIGNYNSQLNQIDSQIGETKSSIKTMDGNLSSLKKNYALMVYTAYKHRSTYSRLLFVLSASSFNDAVRRILYLRRYSAYRRTQADLIVQTKNTLSGKVKVLSKQKNEKKELLTQQQAEKDKLQKEKTDKDKVVKQLSSQEKKIKSDLAVKKKEQDKLNKLISDAIKKEILASTKKTTTTTTTSGTKTTTTITSTPEIAAMSSSFVANQGKFPWPVSEGIIIESFGTHPHPVLKNVTTKNNGCDIKTNAGANVRAIFKGTVVSVLANPGYHTAVIIRHGDYFTVYSNMASVTVKPNDKVETKQSIGRAYTDKEEGTMVHLEIWKGTTLLDPENWLAPK
ncbi:MAG: peptidoglycan DD-metalloendopeptidase family protein [Bacteroidota bacterium]